MHNNLQQLEHWLQQNHHRFDVQLLRNIKLVLAIGDAAPLSPMQLQAEFSKDPADPSSLLYDYIKAKAA